MKFEVSRGRGWQKNNFITGRDELLSEVKFFCRFTTYYMSVQIKLLKYSSASGRGTFTMLVCFL